MSKISILIPTFREPEALDLCLRSCIMGCSNLDNIEILVGVDGYYNLNKDVLDKWSKYIKLLVMDENVGLNRMTNLLVYNSSNPYFLLVNDDNVFGYEWDLALEKIHDRWNDSVITPNQIEPYLSIFIDFVLEDLGRDPKSFNLDKFWEREREINQNLLNTHGSTFPIFMSKLNFLKIGGWPEIYPGPWVCDLDLFLRCHLNNIKTIRTFNTHFYHFVSIGTRSYEKEEANRIIESQCHETYKYIWGQNVIRNPITNAITLSNENKMITKKTQYL